MNYLSDTRGPALASGADTHTSASAPATAGPYPNTNYGITLDTGLMAGWTVSSRPSRAPAPTAPGSGPDKRQLPLTTAAPHLSKRCGAAVGHCCCGAGC
ncbi:hypothetical protein QFZ79_000511 [Arthrobacter sp. V4I6]|uniref:hypothetical protein n=1 Tax=Arthrobacter sp. V4I6 TaxID=3042281 RepID=UPI0027879633|nr:hypothetical protein [Arthrobacter sp. V4I6]MDQ0852400.1 hypothetical protein [Arthrobacter sp. V4I6]